jgi:hypothetical protein
MVVSQIISTKAERVALKSPMMPSDWYWSHSWQRTWCQTWLVRGKSCSYRLILGEVVMQVQKGMSVVTSLISRIPRARPIST